MILRTTEEYENLFTKAGYDLKMKSPIQKFDNERFKCQFFAITPGKSKLVDAIE